MRFAQAVNMVPCNRKVMESISFYIAGRQRDLLSQKKNVAPSPFGSVNPTALHSQKSNLPLLPG